ncbi:retrotransposon protein, putative, ty1-copia subclass, partial [Tanacetum coccineum]
LTPSYTPRHNDVSERRNHTLLDMVRSMVNLTTLQLSFWDYALETATRILNMVPTKKVDKIPNELWYGKVPNLSVKCIFIGYPKETMGYYFYFPPENQIVVASYAEFLEKNLIYQEVSRRAVELEEIQDEDTSPSKNTSEIPMEVEGFKPPQEKVVPVRRSTKTHRAPNRLCLNVEVEEHSLGDLNELTNYKVALLDPNSDKWVGAMNAEMQSIKDNQVWCLVDLPPISRLVAMGYTQTYGVDYEETFSPVADIRAIRILIAITAFYDYEIWQMDVKGEATFILGIRIYQDKLKRLIGLSQSAYMDKILKRFRRDTSKRGYIPMQERLDLNKTQGASTPEEVKSMQNVPYASAVGCITYAIDRDDKKSQTGYVFILNKDAADWKSSKQSTTAMSATKAEYIAALKAVMEGVWIRKFISRLGIVPTINKPIKMFYDNSAALHFAKELGVQRGTRHYHRRYHYVRECIELGEINLLKVHTNDNLANAFTKDLSK